MAADSRFHDEWLVRAVLEISGVTPEVIEEMRRRGRPGIAHALVESGLAGAETIGIAVGETFGVPFLDVKPELVDRRILSLVPEKVCRRRHLIPVELGEEDIVVAMANPMDPDADDDIRAVSGRSPSPRYCSLERIDALIAELYSPEKVVNGLVDRLGEAAAVELIEGLKSGVDDDAADALRAPVIRLANSIIANAVKMRASDIHIEHEEDSSMVRCRVDGRLRNVMALPRSIASMPLVSRIKVMSDLDLAEHRKPQDGRAKLRVDGAEIGLRVSILPTAFGEKVVIRILDKRVAEVPFDRLGFKPDLAARLEGLLRTAQGVLLVTGPTGSGKTTTLYSMLNRLKSEKTNIVTAEDPIEYKLTGINQVQVNEKAGLDFAAILRSVLRQDPNIILVGEIRDRETAAIAFQAANTGHLVLSTLHTNDALSSIARLADMGIERFRLAPGLIAVTAQRLVRRLCADCRLPVPAGNIPPEALELLRANGAPEACFEPKGCERCDFSGYKGRLSILELLEVAPKLKEQIAAGADETALRHFALSTKALYPMAADAAWHISQGDTTPEEVLPYLHAPDEEDGGSADVGQKPRPASAAAPQPAGMPAASEGHRAEPGASAVAESALGTAKRALGPARVLVVDDELANRFILRKCLEGQGHVVEEANDGLAAIEKITSSPPDILLLDLKMPNLDGYGVLRALRQTLGMNGLPVIVITTLSDDKSQEEAFEAGADDYVLKPFNPQLVVARVKAALRRRDLG